MRRRPMRRARSTSSISGSSLKRRIRRRARAGNQKSLVSVGDSKERATQGYGNRQILASNLRQGAGSGTRPPPAVIRRCPPSPKTGRNRVQPGVSSVSACRKATTENGSLGACAQTAAAARGAFYDLDAGVFR